MRVYNICTVVYIIYFILYVYYLWYLDILSMHIVEIEREADGEDRVTLSLTS